LFFQDPILLHKENVMNIRRLLSAGLLALLVAIPALVSAQDDQQLAAIRTATEKFRTVETALAEGYAPQFGCVSQPEHGAMGIHHINGDLFTAPAIDPLRPEAVMYEPQADGTLQAVGIEYVVLQDAWHAAGNTDPPVLMGQKFNLTTNFFDVPPFYALHIWLWKENPAGLFTSYNPNVSCAAAPATPQRMPDTGGDAGWAWLAWGMLVAGGLVGGGWILWRRAGRAG
jgi:LPXTG-motif cell wall-anchored protein